MLAGPCHRLTPRRQIGEIAFFLPHPVFVDELSLVAGRFDRPRGACRSGDRSLTGCSPVAGSTTMIAGRQPSIYIWRTMFPKDTRLCRQSQPLRKWISAAGAIVAALLLIYALS
jgi:hypothetical protein